MIGWVRGRSVAHPIAENPDAIDLELDHGTGPQISAQLQPAASCDRATADDVPRLELYGA